MFLVLSFSTLAFISSCNTFDPPLTVPVYGHIDSIQFIIPKDSSARLGSASAKIPYAWVYLDDNPVGAFQMPCTFPMVAKNGIHTVEVYPAIIPVGGSSPAFIYPFYQFYTVTINMQEGNTYKIKPTSTYFNWVKFPYMENFENDGGPGNVPRGIVNYHGNGNASAGSDTTMHIIGGKQAFQSLSGMVIVDEKHPYYIGVTWPGKPLYDSNNASAYVELNYRSTALFTIGMFDEDTTSQSGPIAIVYPTSSWNKMYVSLNSTLTSFPYQPQNIYFTISLDAADHHTADTLLLDNIKILESPK